MIKRHKKICRECGEPRYLVGNGLCLYHYNVEYAQKAHRRALERLKDTFSPSDTKQSTYHKKVAKNRHIAPRKKSLNVTDKWLREHWGFNSQVELFDYIWLTRPKRCPISGKDLKPFEYSRHERAMCCSHTLPKGLWPLFRLNPDNILLIHPEVHMLLDSDTEEARAKHPDWDWDLHFALQDSLKIQYQLFKEKHLL